MSNRQQIEILIAELVITHNKLYIGYMSNKRLWQKIRLQGKTNNYGEQLDNAISKESRSKISNMPSRSQSQLGIFGKKRKPSQDQQLGIFKGYNKQMSYDSFLDNNKSQLLSKPLRISVTHQVQKQSIIQCESQDYDEANSMKNDLNFYNIRQVQEQNKSIYDKIKNKFKENISGIRLLILILSQQNSNLKQLIKKFQTQIQILKESMYQQFKQKATLLIKSIQCQKCLSLSQKMAQINKKYEESQQKYERCQYNYNKLQQKYNIREEQMKQIVKSQNINQSQKHDHHTLATHTQEDSKRQQRKRYKTQNQQLPKQKYSGKFTFNKNELTIQKIERQYQRKLYTIQAQVIDITESYNELIEKIMEQKNIIQHEHSVMQAKLQLTLDQVQLLKRKISTREANHKEECAILLNKIKEYKEYKRSRSKEYQRALPKQGKYLTKYNKNHYSSILDGLQQSPNHSFTIINIADELNLNNSYQNINERDKRRNNTYNNSSNGNIVDIEALLCQNRHKAINNSRLKGVTRPNDLIFDKALNNLNELQRGVRMQINRSKLMIK